MLFDEYRNCVLLEFNSLETSKPHSILVSKFFNHQSEKRRLGSIEVVDAHSIGHKAVSINDFKKAPNDRLSGVQHIALN